MAHAAPPNGLDHLLPASGAAVAFARAVTDASGGQCSDLLGVTCFPGVSTVIALSSTLAPGYRYVEQMDGK